MGTHVLLNVDDHAPGRYARTSVLRRAGFEVVEAETGEGALGMVAERKPALVLLDVFLPDMNGLDVCRRIKASTGPPPFVLMVSAMAVDSRARVQGLNAGADGYLMMPAEPEELLAHVRTLLRLHDAEQVRREAEDLHRATAEQRRTALEIAQLGTWEFDVASGLATFDARTAEIMGFPTEPAVSVDAFLAVIHPEDRPRVAAAIEAALAPRGGRYETEYRVIRQDGVRSIAARGRATGTANDGAGNGWRFVGTVMDVTVQKQTETALRHQTELLTAIIDNIPVLLVIWDAELQTFRFNRYLREVLGWTEADAADGRFMERVYPDPEYRRQVSEYMRSLRPGWRDLKNTARDGTAIDISWANVNLSGGASIGIGVDIRERKAAEQALARANQELADADRRKDEFIALLAHELRNPLAPVRMSIGVLRAHGPSDPILVECRDVIDRQVALMARLLDDLLDVSRLVRGRLALQRAPVLLKNAIEAALEVSRPLIDQHRHEVTIEGLDPSLLLEGDAARLTQVFGNLLNNAAKYTEPGGRIHIGVNRQDHHVRVAIRDTGIGIDPALLGQVFDLFTQVHDAHPQSYGGLGIGLSLAQRLVEMHGGRITASSAGPGTGSEFVVTLPVITPRPPSSTAVTAADAARPLLRKRVLVADDNVDSADMVAMLLRGVGCDVRIAYDGEAAVREADAFRPDLVLLDIGMPGLNGFDACAGIRQQPWATGTVIVAVTGWGQDEDRRRSASAGFDRHLVKPVDPHVIVQLVRELPALPRE